MKTKIIAFFNNKAKVGKTSLVYHLAWMYNELGYRVVAADLDPQANLSTLCLGEDRVEELWLTNQRGTIFGSVQPLLQGGDISEPHLEFVTDELVMLAGDIELFQFESLLAKSWSNCLHAQDIHDRSFRIISAFRRIFQQCATAHRADIVLIDLASNLGAINRAALIAADYIIVPLSLDFFALQGLNSLGMTLQNWRKQWRERLENKNSITDAELPLGKIEPLGYTVLKHPVRFDRPVKTNHNLFSRIPKVYFEAVLNQPVYDDLSIANDPNCLAMLTNYHTLMQMALEANKPMFLLKPADGMIGSYFTVSRNAYQDYKVLALSIAEKARVNQSSNYLAV